MDLIILTEEFSQLNIKFDILIYARFLYNINNNDLEITSIGFLSLSNV
jgi:hypothetical protein